MTDTELLDFDWDDLNTNDVDIRLDIAIRMLKIIEELSNVDGVNDPMILKFGFLTINGYCRRYLTAIGEPSESHE